LHEAAQNFFEYSRVKLKNQKPKAVDVLFMAFPMVPLSCGQTVPLTLIVKTKFTVLNPHDDRTLALLSIRPDFNRKYSKIFRACVSLEGLGHQMDIFVEGLWSMHCFLHF
jgi:hypothetical protein